jgi:hypothetical protein
MMRLSLYDGTGFDYLTAIIQAELPGLAVLLIAYMCFNAMILLNGLIGVFGSAFNVSQAEIEGRGDDDDDDDDKDDLRDDESRKKLEIIMRTLQSIQEDISKNKKRKADKRAKKSQQITSPFTLFAS